MFYKIALNNVKRSFRDYSIYFLTLTIAVCIFYSFNSFEEQTAMLEMGKSTSEYMLTFNKLIAGTSIFVSFILGGLITYANNFLIKKRKKELGIYMTLGMSKGKISRILIFETLLIGLISLVVGTALGIIVSQGLSVITAQLLAVEMSQYKFVVSFGAVIKTAVYFGIIYLLVMIFNQVTISKYKLIDMLNAAKKNEVVKLKNAYVSIFTFLISLIVLAIAYALILENGMNSEGILLIAALLMGVIGTLLFFFSLSNFMIHIVQKNKKLYLKDLNIFILRQINNKINTNFVSMTVICLMLFLTITLLFTMFSFKSTNDKMVEGNTSFDASSVLIANDKHQEEENEIENFLEKIDFKFQADEKHTFFSEYKLTLTLEDLLTNYLSEQELLDFQKNYMMGALSAVKISDYNSSVQLKGQKPIELKGNEVLIVSNYGHMNKALDKFMDNEDIINIEGKDYTIKNDIPIAENILTTATALSFFYLIVPDDFSGELILDKTGFNVMFEGIDPKKSEEKFTDLFTSLWNDSTVDGINYLVLGNTIDQVNTRVHGLSATIVFLGIYLGLIFLISSAAVMALQQLSDASDSLERYQSLRRIGVTEKLINKAILIQNLIYFAIPLGLAIIHSIVGISMVNEVFKTYSQSIIGSSMFIIISALLIIYGGYFYATYVGFKNIVKSRN
ncbi:FtsX-like permease family protein [Solibacillus sp. A46]|uniref:FtsX-like permease family protein n=1 Tax=Solibacillus faecavium TaxID=2762221 RepID=A0ABR8Y107_9BACL|nr:FtsX-like permease family protein [Solibacillus faecavium]MBD8037864.1 FtsX-like permease family protein [Solibacillus faecavium]